MESFKSVLSTSWHSHRGQERGEGAQEGGSGGGGRRVMHTTSWGAKPRRKNYLQPQAGLQQAHKTLVKFASFLNACKLITCQST